MWFLILSTLLLDRRRKMRRNCSPTEYRCCGARIIPASSGLPMRPASRTVMTATKGRDKIRVHRVFVNVELNQAHGYGSS